MVKRKRRRGGPRLNKFLVVCFILLVAAAIALQYIPGAWSFVKEHLPFLDEPRQVTTVEGEMSVHFLDVGQGDCSLIILPGGLTVLVDASTKDAKDEILQYLHAYDVTEIDYFVLTHPHADHIGSAEAVIKEFTIKAVIKPDAKADTAVFEKTLTAIDDEGAKLIIPEPKQVIKLGQAVLTFLSPIKESDELNDMSVVFRLDYGGTSFLFTGDAEASAEKLMLERFASSEFKADVLKIGHHGASTSSSADFLDAVSPTYAVISCGKDNSYGHPHDETLKALEKRDITYYRTDLVGNVVFSSDGEKLTVLRPAA